MTMAQTADDCALLVRRRWNGIGNRFSASASQSTAK